MSELDIPHGMLFRDAVSRAVRYPEDVVSRQFGVDYEEPLDVWRTRALMEVIMAYECRIVGATGLRLDDRIWNTGDPEPSSVTTVWDLAGYKHVRRCDGTWVSPRWTWWNTWRMRTWWGGPLRGRDWRRLLEHVGPVVDRDITE